jgi:hypothetical protein
MRKESEFMKFQRTAVCVALAVAFVASAGAQIVGVYNSVPFPLPGNVASEGPEAYGFAALGDGVKLSAAKGTVGQVIVIMSSWACQSGNWYQGTCTTRPGATFLQPITVNLYSVSSVYSSVYAEPVPTPQALLGSITQKVPILYRPSVNAKCGNDTGYGFSYPTQWYDPLDKSCNHGIAVPIAVDFSKLNIALPANNELIVTVSYNTTDYGPSPIGTTACNSTTQGCPYDALNISVDGNGPTGITNGIGSLLDYNGIFVNYTLGAEACPGNTVTGTLALDSPCWTGYHPQIAILANVKNPPPPKGHGY